MDKDYKKKYLMLLKKDNTPKGDVERHPLFYIISSVPELWELKESIYNFKERCIKPEILSSSICQSSKALIKLGFNLFNSYNKADIFETFVSLDDKNREIALTAIGLRFDINNYNWEGIDHG